MILVELPDATAVHKHLTLGKDYEVTPVGNGFSIAADNHTEERPNRVIILASRFKTPGVVERRACTKEQPMALELGPRAVELGIIWDHDDIVDLDPNDECERFVPFMCRSCGFKWAADLGD
jgi:hypothetical protein